MTLDFHSHMLALGVDGHDVHWTDGGWIFTAYQLGPLADTFDLLGQVSLQMVFHTVLDEARIFAQVIRLIGIDVLQRHFQNVRTLIGAHTQHFFRHRRIHIIISTIGRDVLQRARCGHPVERFIGAQLRENQQTGIGLNEQHTLGQRQRGIETAGVLRRTVGNNNSHRPPL